MRKNNISSFAPTYGGDDVLSSLSPFRKGVRAMSKDTPDKGWLNRVILSIRCDMKKPLKELLKKEQL